MAGFNQARRRAARLASEMTKPREAGAWMFGRWNRPKRLALGGQRRDDDRRAVLRALDGEADMAVDQREQRVVLADADIHAGVEPRAALADDDRTGGDQFTAVSLDAQHLGLGVAAVPCGTAAFFLCHELAPQNLAKAAGSAVDRADFQLGVVLAMALALLVVLATAHLEDADLVVLAMADNLGADRGAGHRRRADRQAVTAANCQYLVDGDLSADFRVEQLDLDLFAGSNLVLLAASLDDCVHVLPSAPEGAFTRL